MMSDPGKSDSRNSDPDNAVPGVSRRTMMAASAAGLLGAVGVAQAVHAGSTGATSPVGVAGSTEDPKAPAGLGRTGVPDLRFPLSYRTPVTEGVRVLMDHMTALSQRDLAGVADTLHYPYASYEGTEVVVIDTRDALLAGPPASINMTLTPRRHSDNDGYLKPGSYDVFHGLEVLASTPINATMAMSYDRYGSDGKKLLRCEGIYAVTNNDGKWAVQMASTIFTPADMIGVVFEDAVRQAKQMRILHALSADTGDESFDRMTVRDGPEASVTGGATWTEQMKGTEAIMSAYRVKGVKSRLRLTDVTAATPLRGDRGTYRQYWDTMGKIGLGPWGFLYGTWKEGRVVHHTQNKAHVMSCAVRYTAAGEEMSLATQALVATFKKGQWAMSGFLIYATPHDRANDIHPGGLTPV